MLTSTFKAGKLPATDDEQMAKYGITRVPVDYFHYRGFRYTSFADALAQAQLQAEEGGSRGGAPALPVGT